MSVEVFVDTNVLVYARDSSEPDKQPLAQAWLEVLWSRKAGRLSRQVLHEYYVTVTGKLDPGLEPARARRDVRDLEAWQPVVDSARLIEDAWRLQDRFSLHFWDGLIAAAARAAGCRHLLTEDLQHGQDLGGVAVVNPFVVTPREILGESS